MPGNVVRIEAAQGAAVIAGQPVLVLEAMKMEHAIRAPVAGVVAVVNVRVGQAVDTGTELARLDSPGV